GTRRPDVRLGYNTNGFTSHRLQDALDVIVGLGFRSVAITLDTGALDPYEPDVDVRAREIGRWLAARDVLPVIETGARVLLDPWRRPGPPLLPRTAPDRQRRIDFLRGAIALAAVLGAPVVSLWSGTPEAPEPAETLDTRLADGLRALATH